MASLTRGGVETLVQSHGVESRPHRPVLQVVKVETVTDTIFSQTRTRHKLWLSDGNRWTIAFASELAGATAGCLVRVLKYHSTNELNIHEMELVGPPQPLIGVPTSVEGSPLPNGAGRQR